MLTGKPTIRQQASGPDDRRQVVKVRDVKNPPLLWHALLSFRDPGTRERLFQLMHVYVIRDRLSFSTTFVLLRADPHVAACSRGLFLLC